MFVVMLFILVLLTVCTTTMVFKAADDGDVVSYITFLFISSGFITGIIFLLK